jgi:nifR3 family TIM-barrel protein
MAGFSDVGLRSLSFRYGAGLCYTEMVSAKGLHYKNENTAELTTVGKDEKFTGIQLFGSDPSVIAEAVASEALKNFPVIDINSGCPVPKIVKNGDGSALLRDPDKIYGIIKAAVSAAGARAVTLKIRKGIDGKARAVEAAVAAEEAGAAMVTVHGRTREQMYSGSVDYDIIAEVKSRLRIPVCGNGDVTDRESYLRMKETGADYVMIGRGAVGRPYIFTEVMGGTPVYLIKKLIAEHMEYLSFLPERTRVNAMKRHIAAYIKGIVGNKKVKDAVFRAETAEELLSLIDLNVM